MNSIMDILSEIVIGDGYMTKGKFGSIVLSEVKKKFPSYANIEIQKSFDYIKEKSFPRANINNSYLGVWVSIEVNDKSYICIIINKFKKVPDEELTNKFTMADDEFLRKMSISSLEPKDFNIVNKLSEWDYNLKTEDGKILIPKNPGYAVLFSHGKTLNECIVEIKKAIDKDGGFGESPVVPNDLPVEPAYA
mgnify:FL=1